MTTAEPTHPVVELLAQSLVLGTLLERVRELAGDFTLLDHFTQGEFHHDVVLRVGGSKLPGPILVVSTNCNGGVKEVVCFEDAPDRGALWHARCPDNPEFEGELPGLLARSRTCHWFEPCDLLRPDARSEYRREFRQRQRGGGWIPKS